MNPLVELQKFGQSPWYDYIRRDLIQSGALTQMIENDGLLGMTSNPSIFEKAIGESNLYDDLFKEQLGKGGSTKEIYEALAIRDIQDAADLFLPVYEKTDGKDGYVSLEVSPDLAYDTQRTIEEARRLFKKVDRKNVMVKVPATPQGIPAIEILISEGMNINVTLLFSVEMYERVAWAYIAGLQRRVAAHSDIRQIASVASFFVSRIDTLIDAQLAAKASPENRCQSLLGKAAIANAKNAYLKFQEIFQSPAFLALKERGGSAQRILWASTSTKNPAYRDTYYVEALIGQETVNTLPAATFTAFRDHGTVSEGLTQNREEAEKIMVALADAGIDMQQVTDRLLADGVTLFADAFHQLMATLNKRRAEFTGQQPHHVTLSMGPLESVVSNRIADLKRDQVLPRLFKKDSALWPIPKGTALLLGWLDIIESGRETVRRAHAFAQSAHAHFKDVILLGMGGSSLSLKTLRAIFGRAAGFPNLHVLDTILPVSIKSLERHVHLSETLFIVSSKSGSTIETTLLCQHFFDIFFRAKGQRAGENFVAITDPGSSLMQYAEENAFREIFAGHPDIGGRYSALSPFGLVPAALMGAPIESLLQQAEVARPYAEASPVLRLAGAMAQLAQEGCDKLTFMTSPAIRSIEVWLEQLIAESTGKQGIGIIPIVGEDLSRASECYGNDRTFVYIRYTGGIDPDQETQVAQIEKAGHPVIRMEINDLIEIGGQFFLWEMATAVAGSILKINPFDQPNVEESKRNTRALLESYKKGVPLSEERPIRVEEGISVFASPAISEIVEKGETLQTAFSAILNAIWENDYVAINAYLPETGSIHDMLQSIRMEIGRRKRVATTLGYGPSYLHSTGQLQKGGPNTVLVFIITSEMTDDIPLPDQAYTLGQLVLAQAMGDFQSLCQRQRRVIRIHLPADIHKGLHHLMRALGER